ncbi:hypothetical protein SODALDRAFT_381422 [Sodiomyces alkalinus F11]|uniref:Uncharacterized protein n=1 Tax=Sodiomyces alkalinus (strain CBS 110278 / VKM F-3762 / F11) TaxID=1314773 RepID=A0A3N2PNW8_SODAK|nr:hypothetical protein SODALDRAFT_381422 [Sodiomyces alkalinus F11]ROT36189.1 hypothetical protein SODALDRAFT_381422 [Sodiomyces alkalinus F11]
MQSRLSQPSPDLSMSHLHQPAESTKSIPEARVGLPPESSPRRGLLSSPDFAAISNTAGKGGRGELGEPGEPPSINSLLRSHCRARLYVPPIAWAALQLDLLGCRFAKVKGPRSPPTPSQENRGDLDPQCRKDDQRQTAIRNARYLRALGTLEFKRAAMLSVLAYFDMVPVQPELPFRFKGQVVKRFIRGPRLKTHTNRVNWPMISLRQKRLRSIHPIKKARDPYIMALLIALAQAQRLEHGNPTQTVGTGSGPQATEANPTPFKTSVAKVQVLALDDGAVPASIYVYTARMPSSFLDKLDRPSDCIPSPPLRASFQRLSLRVPEEFIPMSKTATTTTTGSFPSKMVINCPALRCGGDAASCKSGVVLGRDEKGRSGEAVLAVLVGRLWSLVVRINARVSLLVLLDLVWYWASL